MNRRYLDIVVVSMIVSIGAIGDAAAYIDPGSGSVITTAIIGFFAAIAYTCRKYFYKLKDMVSGRRLDKTER